MKPTILRQSPTDARNPPWPASLADLRLRIVDRYLLRELAANFLAATSILLLIVVGTAVADLLAKIARGRIPADLLFTLIALRSVDALTVLLPLAVFLAVLLAYGRLWRDSEMAVLQSSGLDLGGLARPLALLIVPTMLLLGTISFWLAPAAVRLSQTLLEEANRSLIIAGLEPGRFIELPGKDGEIYVGEMSSDGTEFKRLFVESERVVKDPGKKDDGTTRIDVITATSGFLYHDADGVGRYLALQDGFRVEGTLGQDDYRLMRFARNDIKLPDSESDDNDTTAKRSAPTRVLLRNPDDPVMRAEIHWRLAAPISALVLTLLALPLSKSSPREPRYARLLVAVLAWWVFNTGLGLGRSWIGQGKLAPAFGFWWVYLPTIAVAAWLIWNSQRMPRAKRSAV
ncbi:MAG TPA: LPS export ABC transporter permease LptF [Rhodanobacteraceae bacterium]|jgi:lipopolysaccharide export system permease protein|nr:LPS export ABC transporter permease LptF [Rhodanobacteraceae bacterium]